MPLDQALYAAGDASDKSGDAGLRNRLMDCRKLSLRLTEPLSEEDQVVQSMADASPTKWHLAHVTWFFEELLLKPFASDYRLFNERFSYCFNSYYETVGPRHPRPQRGLLTRPSLAEVHDYRSHVDEALDRLFDQSGGDLPDEALDIIEIGINHEQQHQELLLMDILSVFDAQPLRPAYLPERQSSGKGGAAFQWVSFDGGIFDVGHNGEGFAYDNEGPVHQQLLRPYKLANRLVTNAEWLSFMEDGGYRNAGLWLSDGWGRVQAKGLEAPLYWERDGDGSWRQMTLRGGLTPIDPAAPVSHVSYFEADAYARWAGARLPTEFEWEVASRSVTEGGNFLGSRNFIPVRAEAEGQQRAQLVQMFGDLWEWTQSPYSPYPGYKPPAGTIGEYNGKFMCNQFVLRGGACVTPDGHIRKTYRNFFYPHQRWQFGGLRLAADA